MDDAPSVALRVGRALDRLGVAYFLGGSLASSLQGEPRSTNALDFVVDLPLRKIEPFARELGADFEVATEALAEAVRRRGSWNIFFLPSMLKIDLFIRRFGPFDDAEFSRRGPVEVRPDESLFVKSAEDTVLGKLLWFRAGGEVSTTQWRDIVQVLRVSGADLDRGYLEEWADRLGVRELLDRVRLELPG